MQLDEQHHRVLAAALGWTYEELCELGRADEQYRMDHPAPLTHDERRRIEWERQRVDLLVEAWWTFKAVELLPTHLRTENYENQRSASNAAAYHGRRT